MIEFWLLQDNDKIQLPINPELYESSEGMGNSTVNVSELGEVNILGKPKLSEITLTSFFPNQYYTFCEYRDILPPEDYVALIQKFMRKGQVRLLITGTSINKIYYIENFTHGRRDGTGDIYYTISFKEFKKIKLKNIQGNDDSYILTNSRPSTSIGFKIPPTYTVKVNDTLWSIARRFYGDGSKYTYLMKLNGIKNPDSIMVGKVLKL